MIFSQKLLIWFLVLMILGSTTLVFAQGPLHFKTPYLIERGDPLIELREARDIETFQKKLEEVIVSVFPSLAPPVVFNVRIENITTNSAVILWETNIRSSSIVALAPAKDFDLRKENPYLMEVGNPEARTKRHRVELLNLNPGTLYHFQVKSISIVGTVGKSQDFTFSTLASKIKLEITRVTNTEIEVRWVTPVETDSNVEYKDLRTGKISKVRDPNKVKSHVILLTNLTPDTSYEIRGFGYDANNILIESDLVVAKTKIDLEPPKISEIRIENALMPGVRERVLTVISWRTNELANSIVYFGEGLGVGELEKKISREEEYVLEHTVILTTRAATVYRIRIVSVDKAGNKRESSIRTFLTPRAEESVLDIIIKNFEETFKFLR